MPVGSRPQNNFSVLFVSLSFFYSRKRQRAFCSILVPVVAAVVVVVVVAAAAEVVVVEICRYTIHTVITESL